MIGAYEVNIKWIRGYGTRPVWNSEILTLNKGIIEMRDGVKEEDTT
jgi:hypothetical protein